MAQQPKRIRLTSLTDVQKQMARLYREHRDGNLSDGQLSALSQHLTRLHNMKVAEKELDISEELLEIENKLAALEGRR